MTPPGHALIVCRWSDLLLRAWCACGIDFGYIGHGQSLDRFGQLWEAHRSGRAAPQPITSGEQRV